MLWISSLIFAAVLGLIINAALKLIIVKEPTAQQHKSITPQEELMKAYRSAANTHAAIQPSDFKPIDAGTSKFEGCTNKFFATGHRGFLEFYIVILFVKVMCLSILLGN
jgi:hypothetical protein